MAHIKSLRCVALVVSLVLPIASCVAQEFDPPEGVEASFGTVPTFFTGTANSLDLNVHAYGGKRLASLKVWIHDQLVLDQQFSYSENKTHRALHINWDSGKFAHGTSVAYSAEVIVWTNGQTQEILNAQAPARSVYNKFAIFADSTLGQPGITEHAAAEASFEAAGHTVQNSVLSALWTRSTVTDSQSGIPYATAIHFACHGLTGVIHAPDNPSPIDGSHIASAVGTGFPQNRPPVNFAFVGSCRAMASNAFGDSFLANSSPGASVGFTFDVNSQDAVDFAQYTYARLLLGYTLAKATYEAFDLVWKHQSSGGYNTMINVRGNVTYKLKGANRSGGVYDVYLPWFYVWPEAS